MVVDRLSRQESEPRSLVVRIKSGYFAELRRPLTPEEETHLTGRLSHGFIDREPPTFIALKPDELDPRTLTTAQLGDVL